MNKFFFVFLFLSGLAFSQTLSEQYNNGLNCFLNKDYVCAKMHFSEIVKNNSHVNQSVFEYSMYYYFLSSLRLYHKDTGYLFDNFINKFPLSNKKSDAIFFMSEYLFEKKEYEQVITLLSQINLYQLDDQNKDVAFFYLGYSCYKKDKYELAKSSFYELIS